MRVLVDYRSALRERSGVGEYTHQMITALHARFDTGSARSPIVITVFSSSWKDRLHTEPGWRGILTVDRRIPVTLLNFAWHRLEWPPVEKLAGQTVDVAHSMHPLLMPTRHAATVVTIHNLNFLKHPERTTAEMRRDYPGLVRSHAGRADRIIVSSRFAAGELERELGVSSTKVSICPAGAPEWTPRGKMTDPGYILFFGTLEPRKNVGALLDAYASLLSTHADPLPELVLAGRVTDDAHPWLDRVAAAPLKGHVRLLGYVAPAERLNLYAGARMLVHPSFEEGFGLTVLEAMTIGVPVIAANRGSLPEVLGNAGILTEVDPQSLAAAMSKMLSDRAFAAACSEAGVARAREFSWTQTADRVYEAYQLAVDAHTKRSRQPSLANRQR